MYLNWPDKKDCIVNKYIFSDQGLCSEYCLSKSIVSRTADKIGHAIIFALANIYSRQTLVIWVM